MKILENNLYWKYNGEFVFLDTEIHLYTLKQEGKRISRSIGQEFVSMYLSLCYYFLDRRKLF